MTNWLDEMDAKYGVSSPIPTGYSLDYGVHSRIRRMSRVLREFAKHIKWLEIRSPTYKDGRRGLSDDAKELLK